MKYVFLLGGLFLSSPLMAQEPDPDNPLVIIIHKPPQSLTAPDQAGASEEQRRIAGATAVVGDEEWKTQKATVLKDMLDFTPGVLVQPRNGAEAARLSIRGSGITRTFQGRGILLMQDGIPVNTADGSFDFQAVDPWLVRYAQVFKGANAVAYGASTLGGAINLVTPTGYANETTSSRMEAGSFGTLHGMLSAGRMQDSWDEYASLTGFHQDGYRRQNEQDSLRFAGNAGWRVTPEWETRFYLGYIESDGEIPGSLTKRQLFANPKQANAPNVAGDFFRGLEIFRLANKTGWSDGTQTVNSTLFWSNRDLDNPATTYIVSRSNDIGERLQYKFQQGEHEWQAGANIQYGLTDEARNANAAGSRGTLVVQRDQEAMTMESYLQYDRALTHAFHLIGSMQQAYAVRRIAEKFPAATAQRTDYFGYNPRIGTRYDVNETMQLFANISRSFEPPTLSELSAGNTPGFATLKAQHATTAEIGTRGAWKTTGWDIALAHAWVENEFITYRFPDGSTSSVNATRTLHDSLELGLTQRLNDMLSLKSAYTWSYFKLDDDPVFGSNRLAGIPEHYMRTQLTYKPSQNWSVTPDVEWSPKAYPVDLANTLYSNGYAIYGLNITYELPKTNVSFYVDGRNLLDKTYIATTGVIPTALGNDQSQFFPGEGRALYAGIKANW